MILQKPNLLQNVDDNSGIKKDDNINTTTE